MNHFNSIRNQNYSLFFQNSPFASSLWPLNRGLFLPRSLGPKRLHSKWATLAPKIVLYFTHRNGPIFGAKTDLLDLECSLHVTLPVITSLINASFNRGIFPRSWKLAVVSPISNHEEPNNDRHISLLPILSKVCERLALNQIMFA